jgi:hypothetical protein
MLDHLRRALGVAALVLTAAALSVGPAAAATPSPSPSSVASPSPGATAPAGSDQDLASFGIAPAGAERPDDRPYLKYAAPPGSVIYDHIALLNQGGTPIDLQLYSGDVVMADGGGLAVPARTQASTDAGAWIAVDTAGAAVTVPAQTKTTGVGYTVVPFSITIPANAQPGDHIGGIVGSLVVTGQAGENSPSINLEQRVVARVYIRVSGDLRPGLAITAVTATYRPGVLGGAGAGTVEVGYTVRNTGNVRMAVDTGVQVAGPFGLLPRTVTGDHIDELLPGGEVHLNTSVSRVWPLVIGTVTVSATGRAAAGGEDPGVGTVRAQAHFWAIPWVALAVLALLLALAAYRIVRKRRRQLARAGRAPSGRRTAPSKRAARKTRASEVPEPVSVGTTSDRE